MSSLDTLGISKRLKSAGFDEAQAEALTVALRESRDADMSRLATKDDVTQLGAALRSEMEMLRRDMEILRRDLTIRLGGMIAVGVAILAAAIKFIE